MAETTSRVLQLLGLLQSRRVWTGEELADRLGVTTRSVRRDVERLRDLGYPVQPARVTAAGISSARVPRCRRCCWTPTKPWPWRSACGLRPAAAWPGSANRRCVR